jgi:hypothetical protein
MGGSVGRLQIHRLTENQARLVLRDCLKALSSHSNW